jgi:hypothetical protein
MLAGLGMAETTPGPLIMALDEAGAVVATVFRDPARLLLLDTKNGSVKANLPICDDADDVFFDIRRGRIYVSCGAGSVDRTGLDRLSPRRSRGDDVRRKNLSVRA